MPGISKVEIYCYIRDWKKETRKGRKRRYFWDGLLLFQGFEAEFPSASFAFALIADWYSRNTNGPQFDYQFDGLGNSKRVCCSPLRWCKIPTTILLGIEKVVRWVDSWQANERHSRWYLKSKKIRVPSASRTRTRGDSWSSRIHNAIFPSKSICSFHLKILRSRPFGKVCCNTQILNGQGFKLPFTVHLHEHGCRRRLEDFEAAEPRPMEFYSIGSICYFPFVLQEVADEAMKGVSRPSPNRRSALNGQ